MRGDSSSDTPSGLALMRHLRAQPGKARVRTVLYSQGQHCLNKGLIGELASLIKEQYVICCVLGLQRLGLKQMRCTAANG